MQFDLLVIGSGPGGYKAALTAAHWGARVALVERELPGGTCLNRGCVPKKALLHLATLIEDINNLQGRGLSGTTHGDFRAAIEHKNSVVAGIRENFPFWLRRLGVQVLTGSARCLRATTSGGYEIEVRTADSLDVIGADRIIVATGSTPRALASCPVEGERILHSGHFMARVMDRPESVLLVGGGAVGTELGYLFHQFGSRVTIAESGERLLNKAHLPERASHALERKFARIGVRVRTGLTVAATRPLADGIEVNFSDGSREQFSHVVVAVGREPASRDLGLADVGVAVTADGFIETNEYLETSARGIYAVGDVKPGPMTANAALHDAKIAATNAIKGNQTPTNYNQVPIVIDSALEIAAVGLTEERAEAAGFSADVAHTSFGSSAKARARNDCEGFIEVVHDSETGQLLGGCIVGAEAGEQIHMMAAACQSERGLWFFTDMNYSHPSWTEELQNTIDPYTVAFTRSGRDLFRPGIYNINRLRPAKNN